MRLLKTKLLTILALTLCLGVFCVPALASDGGETLTVSAVWIDGDLLRINVTDANGVSSALALNLADYVSDAGNQEYISIQAIDLMGNSSGTIEIKNPFYEPPSEQHTTDTPNLLGSAQPTESSVQDSPRPFTPDGTGTVMDNAHDGDGKEFFTIGTEAGDVFYLIVDRQRNADNVYLLNAVTEEDLMALAEKNGREIAPGNSGMGATPTPEPTGEPDGQNPLPTDASEPEAEPPAKSDASMYILIAIAVIGVGGAGYYFKIVKGKKNADDDEEYEDDYGYDDEQDDDGYEDDDEEGGDEE